MLRPRSAVLILMLALVVPMIGCDSGDDAAPDEVTVNGAEITDRQRAMLDIVDGYIAAWSATQSRRS